MIINPGKISLKQGIIEEILIKEQVLQQTNKNGFQRVKRSMIYLSSVYDFDQVKELKQNLEQEIQKEYDLFVIDIADILFESAINK